MMFSCEDSRYQIFEVIKPYENWWDEVDSNLNSEAKQGLKQFYTALEKIKVDTDYQSCVATVGGHFSYLLRMILIRQALDQKQYQRVCNEIYALAHYELFFQGRVYYNVLSALKNGLEMEA